MEEPLLLSLCDHLRLGYCLVTEPHRIAQPLSPGPPDTIPRCVLAFASPARDSTCPALEGFDTRPL